MGNPEEGWKNGFPEFEDWSLRRRQHKQSIFSISCIIIHQTHYEKSDWSRAFNQFTKANELDMINAISAADLSYQVHKLL